MHVQTWSEPVWDESGLLWCRSTFFPVLPRSGRQKHERQETDTHCRSPSGFRAASRPVLASFPSSLTSDTDSCCPERSRVSVKATGGSDNDLLWKLSELHGEIGPLDHCHLTPRMMRALGPTWPDLNDESQSELKIGPRSEAMRQLDLLPLF